MVPGRLTVLLWMVPYPLCMDNANWSWWAIKNQKEYRKLGSGCGGGGDLGRAGGEEEGQMEKKNLECNHNGISRHREE